jgi:hypothetical protein
LAIANNLPLSRIRDFLARLSPWLAIEFVPKTDANARELLTVREDIFADYTQEGFEKEFSLSYAIERKVPVQDSRRVLFLMRRRGDNDSTQEGYAPQQGRKSIHSSGLESSAKGDGAIREISAR